MKYIKKFNNYKTDIIFEKKFNETAIAFKGVELNQSDISIFIDVFNSYLNRWNIDESIKYEIEDYIHSINFNEEILNESFFNKLKGGYRKASEISKGLTNSAKNVLGDILKATKNALEFVNKISDGIKEIFISVISTAKTTFKQMIIKGELKSKIDELTNTKKQGLVKDLKVIKELILFYKKDFLPKLLDINKSKMTEFLSKEQTPITEAFKEKASNVISVLVRGVGKIPPFSWFNLVAKAGEAGANKLISSISKLTENLGGPNFELPVIALLVGVAIKQIVKSHTDSWLLTLATSTTPLGMAIFGMKIVAMFIGLIVTLDAVLGTNFLSQENHKNDH